MTSDDPERLLVSRGGHTARLLASAKHDELDGASIARLRRRLGLAGAAGLALVGTAAMVKPAAAAAKSQLLWVATAVVGSAAVALGVLSLQAGPATEPMHSPAQPAQPKASHREAPPIIASSEEAGVRAILTREPSPPSASAFTAPLAPSVSLRVPMRPQPSGLAAELESLDGARRALAGGQPRAAIRAVAEYQRRFPRGALAEEATTLRIEALARSGQRSQAEGEARRFLQASPRSPQAARVRSLLRVLESETR